MVNKSNGDSTCTVDKQEPLTDLTELSKESEDKQPLTMNIPVQKRPPEFVFWMG